MVKDASGSFYFAKEHFLSLLEASGFCGVQTSLCKQMRKRTELSTPVQMRDRMVGKDTRFVEEDGDLPGFGLEPKDPVLSRELGEDITHLEQVCVPNEFHSCVQEKVLPFALPAG